MLTAFQFTIVQPRPFHNPPVDALRMLCVILAVLQVCYLIRVVREQRQMGQLQPGQLDRSIGLGLLLMSVAYTEIVVQGTPLTIRLPFNLLGVAISFRGWYRMRKRQRKR